MGKSHKRDITDSQRTLILRRFELLPMEWATSPELADWAGMEVGDVDVLMGQLQDSGIITGDFNHGGYNDSTRIRWSLIGATPRWRRWRHRAWS